MDFKKFFDKLRLFVTTKSNIQPKISIDFDTWDSQLRDPLTLLWERFEAEFEESFQDVELRKWSDQCQKEAALIFDGLKIKIKGSRYKNPDYKPSREPSRTPQERADDMILRWLSDSYVFENASPRKLRTLLTVIEDALGYDTMVKPDVELINAVNRLTLTLHKRDTKKHQKRDEKIGV